MQKIYTENDIVRYIYNEVSTPERKQIENALESDTYLMKVYAQMKEVVLKMDKVKFQPHPSSVELILEHSKASSHLEASI